MTAKRGRRIPAVAAAPALVCGMGCDSSSDETGSEPTATVGPRERLIEVARDLSGDSDHLVVVELEYDEYPAGEWPFGEAVHVVTSASLADIDRMTAAVDADPAFEGPWDGALAALDVPDGERVVTIWWD